MKKDKFGNLTDGVFTFYKPDKDGDVELEFDDSYARGYLYFKPKELSEWLEEME